MATPARSGLAWTAEDKGKLLLMAEAGFTIRTAAEQLERGTKAVKLMYCDLKKIRRGDVRDLKPDITLSTLNNLAPDSKFRAAFEKLVTAAFRPHP